MKPILEWYEQLPEPIRSQAIANYDGTEMDVESLHDAIFSGIHWRKTPEGDDYWSDIHTKAEDGEFDKPDLAKSITQLEATLKKVQQALAEVRKAIRNENISNSRP